MRTMVRDGGEWLVNGDEGSLISPIFSGADFKNGIAVFPDANKMHTVY